MFAFSFPVAVASRHATTLGHTSQRQQPVHAATRSTTRRVWRAAADDVPNTPDTDPGLMAGNVIRDKLDALTRERTEQAERTSQRLREMGEQLTGLMTQMRAEAGMPPIADPPASDDTEDVQPDTSSDPSPSSSNASATTAADDPSSSSDEPYMDPSNFGYESTAGWQVLAESLQLPENDDNLDFRIACDQNGCSIIEVKGSDAVAGPGVRQKFIHSAPGYRVGFDPEAPKSFSGMVGNDHWAIALSSDEVRHFKRMCLSLAKKMDRIASGEEEPPAKKPNVRRSGDGMYNMRISRAGLDCSVELESKLVWVQGIGQPVMGQYCVRAIFMESRQSEVFWGPDCISSMFSALNKLRIE